MTAAQPIDVRDMKIVHETFRRAYSEGAQLLRANPTPSAERVAFLSDHLDFGIAMLHHHHESEDELLYPLLAERAPEQAERIREIEAQHQDVSSAIDAVTAAGTAWRSNPNPQTAEELASRLDSLNELLQPHLDDEEQVIVPLAAVTLTQEEWEAVGEHSRSYIPKDRMPIAFGMLLEPLNEDDRAHMKSVLPFPVRLLYPILIQRPWDNYAKKLRQGT